MPSHRSRLCGVLVDVPAAGYDDDVAFWSAALQRDGVPEDDDPTYTTYGEATPGVEFMVQSVGDDRSRIHLDIETDDVAAEVARLEALGATVVDRIETWVVMRDPVGIIFCVIRVQDANRFQAEAKTWT